MPHIGATATVAVQHRQIGQVLTEAVSMRMSLQWTEQPRQVSVALRVDVLVREEQDQMLVPRALDRGECRIVDVAEVDTSNDGATRRGNRGDLERVQLRIPNRSSW
jgi:hypothetical protein